MTRRDGFYYATMLVFFTIQALDAWIVEVPEWVFAFLAGWMFCLIVDTALELRLRRRRRQKRSMSA